MNKDVFRLVFSKHLGMFVPAPETATGHSGKSSCSQAHSLRRELMALMSVTLLHALPAQADMPAGLMPHATQLWSNAAIDAVRTSANLMTITQTAPKALLNWQQLNLNPGQTLNFDQGGNRSWSALNRIYDANPSVINGNVNADGHIYFINSNGIIFGSNAQINVGSLTASSLDITDDLFNKGVISNPINASFSGISGYVHVEAGAAINAASGGRVMLLAPEVTNSGVINTPEGQTILAAGKKVYLTKSDDPAGLLVEVDSGGVATNLGDIVSRLGNVTLVGLAVNQQGRISASTSVRANGSIRLLARDTVTVTSASTTTGGVTDTTYTQKTTNSGVLTLGKNSVTQIEAEVADKEEILKSQLTDAIGNKVLGVSKVEMSGGVINIDGSIIAHGGDVSVISTFNPSSTDAATAVRTPSSAVNSTRVYLGDSALIDVSGLNATAPMSRNQLEIQLYSEQLKDTPLLRGTDLVGKTIYVDARKGTDLISVDALAAAKAIKGITIAEVMTKAGTVKLESKLGDVVLAKGSKIDVSGGSIVYDAGFIRESQLTYNGKSVAVSEANKNTPYDGLLNSYSVTSKKWGATRTWDYGSIIGKYYNTYTEGSDAGALVVSAQNALLLGDFKALTKLGYMQRNSAPVGGTFSFTLSTPASGVAPTFRIVTDNSDSLSDTFSVVGALDVGTNSFANGSVLAGADILLDNKLFADGFSKFNLDTGSGAIVVDAAIHTTPKGSVNLTTKSQAIVNADIVSPGGVISVSGGNTMLADHVTMSTSGIYTNDSAGATNAISAAIALDGGSVSIAEKDFDKGGLSLGNGVVIEANAGAWLGAEGNLIGGKGGSVVLNGVSSLDQVNVSAFGFGKGGSLALSTLGNLQAGGQDPAVIGTLWLSEAFFGKGGFNNYTIETILPNSSVLIGDAAGSHTEVHPQTQALVATSGYHALASGAGMMDVAKPLLEADALRKSASIKFKSAGTLTVAENAIINIDAPNVGTGGVIDLQSIGQMNILGSLIAPAGSISTAITGRMADFSYDNTLSLFIGQKALLSAVGYYAVTPMNNGLLNASVLDAGSISVNGGERAVVVLKEGSVLDVTGVSGKTDVALSSGYTRQTINGAAGSIDISARNGMVLDGDMHAAASGAGFDGSLTLTFASGGVNDGGSYDQINGARVLTVTQDKVNLGTRLNVGDALDGLTGGGFISTKQIADAGFGKVKLDVDRGVTGDKVLLSDGLNLQLQNSLTLKTSLLEVANGGTAKLTADYVAIGGDSVVASVAGDAELQVDARWVDLVGDIAVTGAKKTTLSSNLDIRGRGTKATVEGSLVTSGDMVLIARQIYPVTNGAFRFEAIGTGNSIEVKSSGVDATAVPLSAAGKLTLKAENIIQGGIVRAPLGQVTLNAVNTLTLMDGSLTSVSGEGQLIPYGLTRLGGLDLVDPTINLVASESVKALATLPSKKVELKASLVDAKSGAIVDISGGKINLLDKTVLPSDTLAYEWINGIGGSSDILGQAGVYAVIPTIKGEYAPFDYNYSQPGSVTKAGDAVHLSNVPGLAEGNYTLLPARYALLPGAYMVQTSNAAIASGRSVAQADGSMLVSGYRLNGSNTDALDSAFKVTSGSIFHTAKGEVSRVASEYRLTTGNQFFTKLAVDADTTTPRLANDAGQLVINASTSLTLNANVLADKQSGARGALVDIVSDKIKVVSSIGDALTGTLQLTASSLNDLKAESLLLGGVRTLGSGEYTITTGASSVAFANDDAHALEVTELMAAASDTLTVEAGAKISTLASTATAGTAKLHTSGDGALLAVSALNNLEFDRSGPPANVKGTLNVASGANVKAHRSMVLDSTVAASLDGSTSVEERGTITLGANRVVLGVADNSVTGLRVSDALLDSFGNLSKVTLNSYKNVDIYGPVSLGKKSLDITLNAGGIAGHMIDNISDNQEATLTAKNFVMKNSLAASGVDAFAATGSVSVLKIDATNINLAGGSTTTTNTVISGFNQVDLKADAEVIVSGVGTTNVKASQTTVTSSRIIAATAADYTLTASGRMATAMAASPATLATANGLGAKLKLAAADLTLGGAVELSSGQITAQATTGDVVVATGAQIKAMSVPVVFDKDYTQYTPGGTVTLQADLGNVTINSAAVVDVGDALVINKDGHEVYVGRDAGTLNILAQNGTTTVAENTIKGQSSAGNQAGKFVLDTKTLPDFSGINTALNAGGFTALRDMRIRSGNLMVAVGETVTAQHVVLSADVGKVDVAGTVDASGSNGGSVEIYARDNVTLKSTGRLLARGTGDTLVAGDKRNGAGGKVVLSSLSTTSIDAISAESGALVDVSGDQQGAVKGEKGSVTMRAYRGTTGNTNAVNVAFGTTAAVNGADEVRLEGVKVYNSATFAANTSTIVTDTNAFYTANPSSGSYAATQDGGTITVLPNIEVRSTSTDLTIAENKVSNVVVDWNMRALAALQAGKGGTLTLRSGKNLNINGSLSDGFNTATTAGVLQAGKTFSYDLVAGADFTAANYMATIKNGGNFNLANSKLIRTGQGDINIAAGGNLTMGNDSSVIYTAGQAVPSFGSFTTPATSTDASYLSNGGDININVLGDITGKIASTGAQLISPWLFRQGGVNKDVSWWVRPDLFKQGVAALGGGNVLINAGGSITNFSVSVPTTARYYTEIDGNGNANLKLSLNGGGDVKVTAGRDIASGVYFSGKGDVSLTAGGEVKSAASTFGTTIALQDASAQVSAVKSAVIETVFNPTLWTQVTANAGFGDKVGNNAYFLTYGTDSAFRLESLTGNTTLGSSDTSSKITIPTGNIYNATSLKAALEIHPATVEAYAFSGNLNVGRLVLAPSAVGNLTLLANSNVGVNGSKSLIALSDSDASLLPSILNPASQSGGFGTNITQFRTSHASTPVHSSDDTPVGIVARDGSIILPGYTSTDTSAGPGLTSSKAVYIHAGKDVSLNADIQQIHSDDITVIEAGRDFTMPLDSSSQIKMGGPGELLVKAGRNVSLGTSKGIVTVANTVNSALSETGASITVLAGLGKEGSNLSEYRDAYIDSNYKVPSFLLTSADFIKATVSADNNEYKKAQETPEALAVYIKTKDELRNLWLTTFTNLVKSEAYRSESSSNIKDYMRKTTGNSELSETEAMAQYLALGENRQAVFAYRDFSSELLASGKGYAISGNHNRGDTAIAALFPSNRSYNGDLSLYNSQLRTYRDGSVDVLTPGGFINAGVPTSSGNNIGIVTERGGDIRAFSETGFQVEQSKVITQYGSDITVWVNNGDIDAGRGSKTAISVPQRVVSTDGDGNTTIEVKGVAAGSGIRAQTYDPDGPTQTDEFGHQTGKKVAPGLGSVALIAPRGVLNASEAGIAAGNFLAVATQVLGANNISVSGTSSGVPAADTGGLAGSLAGISNVADATKSISDNVARQPSANALSNKSVMPSLISVEVIGLGE